MLWQIPSGHLQLTNGIDTRDNHAATAPDYFFGDTQLDAGLTNIKSYIQAITLPAGVYNCQDEGCQMNNYLTMHGYTWHHSNMHKAKNSHVFPILWGGGSTTNVGSGRLDDDGWLKDKVNAYEQHPTKL